MEHRKTGRLLLPLLYCPMDSALPRAGNGAWVTNYRYMPGELLDNEVPAAAQQSGGPVEQSRSGTERPFPALILFFTCFLACPFASKCSLDTLLFAGLQVKGVPLDLLDNVFLLHLAFEAAQGVF